MSRQDYQTPPEFLAALALQFGRIAFDLACSIDTMVGPSGWTEEQNALTQDWARAPGPVAFCNPPFANIRPWAKKCDGVRWLRRWTLLLVPYSGASAWWAEHVLNKAMVYGIPRLTFVGCADPYPKDLALCAYGYGVSGVGFWDWRLAK